MNNKIEKIILKIQKINKQMLKFNMMLLVSYVILAILIQMGYGQKVELDLNKIEILGSKQQYRIKMVAKNGKPPYSFKYTGLPKNWIETQKYLFAPKSNSNIYEQYLISVVVNDSSRTSFKCSLIFLSNYAHMLMDTTIFLYNSQLPYSISANINMPVLKTPFEQGLQQKIRNIIQQANKNRNLPTFDKTFEKLPLPSEIEQIIQTSNIPALIKLISKVPKAQLNCIQQLGYLTEISSISVYVLRQKKNRLDELLGNYKQKLKDKEYSYPEQTINANRSEEIRILQQQIAKLNTSTIKQQYLYTIDKLKKSYSDYNKISEQLQTQKSTLVQIDIQLDRLTKQYNNKNTDLQQINVKLAPTTLNPKQRAAYQKSYDDVMTTLSYLNNQIQKRNQLIKQKQQNISKLSDLADSKSVQGKQIQVDIERLQSTISQNYIKQLKLRESLSFYYLDSKIIFVFRTQGYHLNLREVGGIDQIVQLQKDISVITESMVYLGSLLDTMYYECYGITNMQKANQTQLFLYSVSYDDFLKYIRNAYQADQKFKIVPSFNQNQTIKITLQRINVLDSIWKQKFGDIVDTPTTKDQSLASINQNFYCQTFKMLESNTGVIISINKNLIAVKSNSQINYVLIGACSRIQMYGKVRPQPGNLMFWRGNQIYKGVYDGYFILIL